MNPTVTYTLRLVMDAELLALYKEKDQNVKPEVRLENAGYDLLIPQNLVVPPLARGFRINHQVCGEMVKDTRMVTLDNQVYHDIKSQAYYLYPRSSISNTPLRMSNTLGVIDKGYRGNYIAAIDNLSDQPYLIEAGCCLFQICSSTLEFFQVEFVSKDQLADSHRGTGGFGSTGK